jgi:hypothetical protein
MDLRAAQDADVAAINRLHRDVWWPERSIEGWTWVQDQPGRRGLDNPWGWVLVDADDRPIGFVGNLIQTLCISQITVAVATGFSIIVTPEARGSARRLIRAVLDQPGMAAVYTLNANRLSSGLYGRHGMRPWPVPGHDTKLIWDIDRSALLAGRAWRSVVGRWPEAGLHRKERLMNRRVGENKAFRLPAGIEVVTDFSDQSDYQTFWQTLRNEGTPVVDRSAAVVRWRQADPDRSLLPVTLAARRDGVLVAVIQGQVNKGRSIEPPILDILDLSILPGQNEAARGLVRCLVQNGSALGVARVRMPVVGPTLMQALGPLAQAARHESGWSHGHAWFRDPELATTWSPTPFDGDYGLCLRPVPMPRRRIDDHPPTGLMPPLARPGPDRMGVVQ